MVIPLKIWRLIIRMKKINFVFITFDWSLPYILLLVSCAHSHLKGEEICHFRNICSSKNIFYSRWLKPAGIRLISKWIVSITVVGTKHFENSLFDFTKTNEHAGNFLQLTKLVTLCKNNLLNCKNVCTSHSFTSAYLGTGRSNRVLSCLPCNKLLSDLQNTLVLGSVYAV